MTAAPLRLRDALTATLAAALERDPAVRLVGEGVGALGGLGGATVGLLDRFGPQRVLDTPVSDSSALGLAVGLALGGLRPVVELGGAALGALPQLLGELDALAGGSSGQSSANAEFPVPVVIRVMVGPEGDALAPSPLRHLVGMRGVDVVAPSTGADLARALDQALCGVRPTVVLEPLSRLTERDPPGLTGLERGRARQLREGDQITVLSWGAAVSAALAAADAAQGSARASVFDLCWLSPLDQGAVLRSVRQTGRVLVACAAGEEPFARDLLHGLTQDAFLSLESPPQVMVGGADAIARGLVDSVQY